MRSESAWLSGMSFMPQARAVTAIVSRNDGEPCRKGSMVAMPLVGTQSSGSIPTPFSIWDPYTFIWNTASGS